LNEIDQSSTNRLNKQTNVEHNINY